MHKIYALWAIPRSTSTAFEWMMRQRRDMDCLHEPFGESWYQGEVPLWPRVADDSQRISGLTHESVLADLKTRAKTGAVFIKDFPHYVDHMFDAVLIEEFQHSFLIRDPAKTITSLYNKWPDFHEKEVGFPEQRALFDLLCEKTGSPPVVIDSDDLLEKPRQVVEAWCDAINIPFIEDALSWEPGARDEVSWWDGGSFHANLRNSDGLKPQKRKYTELDQTPERVREVYAKMKPHYEYLHSFRLKPSATNQKYCNQT